LAAAWLVYFAFHSLLAARGTKAWVAARCPHCLPAYRLAFNVVALGLLPIPLWLSYQLHGPLLWRWPGAWHVLADGLALAAVAGLLWSFRQYDGSEFIGLSQWRRRERGVDDQEHFHLTTAHRFVRHPWYFYILIILWTRSMDRASLLNACVISVYFILGSRLEERKLLHYHGEVYRRYRQRVPALFPLPWRYLGRDDARVLLDQAGRERSRTQGDTRTM